MYVYPYIVSVCSQSRSEDLHMSWSPTGQPLNTTHLHIPVNGQWTFRFTQLVCVYDSLHTPSSPPPLLLNPYHPPSAEPQTTDHQRSGVPMASG